MKRNFFNLLILSLSVFVFFILVRHGWSAGRTSAQDTLIINSLPGLKQGLQFAYNDLDRFPQALEFQDQKFMQNYFNPFPFKEFKSNLCPQTYAYKRMNPGSYELSFCLGKSRAGFNKGWNKIIGTAS